MGELKDGSYCGDFIYTYPDEDETLTDSGDLNAIVRKSGKEIVIEYFEEEALVQVNATSEDGVQFSGTWRSESERGTVTLKLDSSTKPIKLSGTWIDRSAGTEGKYIFDLESI